MNNDYRKGFGDISANMGMRRAKKAKRFTAREFALLDPTNPNFVLIQLTVKGMP